MKDLPINLLRTFVVVADTLNLTEAARRLHKAPSTVSMQLNRLEDLVAKHYSHTIDVHCMHLELNRKSSPRVSTNQCTILMTNTAPCT